MVVTALPDAGGSDPVREAEARIASLEAEIAARDMFIATIGHELRNPMVPIVLSLDRVRRFAAAGQWERAQSSLDTLERAADAFMRRATQLLDLSRLSGDGARLALVELDVRPVLLDAAARHRDTARRAGCGLEIGDAPEMVVRGDREAIDQILDNVLLNAFKYGAGRPVVLSIHGRAERAALCVRDHGEGVPAEVQGGVFHLFDRGRNPELPGLGIGLFIASRLAEAMGGAMRLRNMSGGGAEFALELPRGASAAAREG